MTREPDRDAPHVDDEVIAAVVDHYDDPEHPDALSVEEVRELLGDLQVAVDDDWDDVLEAVRERRVRVTVDEGDVVVFRDTERRLWNDLLDDVGVTDRVARTVLRVTHHQTADRLVDRRFEGSDPLVVRKPARAEAGQRFVEAAVESLLRQGVPPEEAWAYYCVDVRGLSGRELVERGAFEDRLSVADAVETARDRL